MGMTRRRRQFLRATVDLFDRTGRAVHYAAVARGMGVSKWTAYDMLKALENEGHLAGEYRAPAHAGGGRSIILFTPTPQGRRAVAGGDDESREWLTLRTALLARLESSAQDGARLIDDLLQELPQVGRPLARAAECVAVLALAVRQAGQDRLAAVQSMAQSLTVPEVKIGFLRGAALMGLLSLPAGESPPLEAVLRVQRLLGEAIAGFGREDRRRLADFMADALQ
jgi:hypothetical protein